jgi:hypothetical protein
VQQRTLVAAWQRGFDRLEVEKLGKVHSLGP